MPLYATRVAGLGQRLYSTVIMTSRRQRGLLVISPYRRPPSWF